MYELPDGSWDMEREEADYQQAQMEAVGRRMAALHRKGVCTHGGGGPVDLAGYKAGTDKRFKCSRCGQVFETDEAMFSEHYRLLD